MLLTTLNRPGARNPVSLALAEGMAAALDRLDPAPTLAVGVMDWRADPVLDSADAREGAAAFEERRAPRWQGGQAVH
ncbi:MAG: hypothetical protein ACSLFR_14570 [Solirubrobacteraceae bacterium]